MKGIVLAAGEGQRLRPLTKNMPKVMIPVGNKPILQYVIEAMEKSDIRDISIVIGYHSEKIRQYFGNGNDFGVKIEYIVQEKQLGTAHALYQAKIDEEFILVPGDNIINENCLKGLQNAESNTIVGIFSKNASKYGIIEYKREIVSKIAEKALEGGENLIFTGIGRFGPEIFQEISKGLEDGIYELPHVLNRMGGQIKLHITECLWKDAVYPWDLLDINSWALKGTVRELSGKIEEANIVGNVEIGDGTMICGGVYIRGPVKIGKNCYIGPNSVILPSTSIGNDVIIGAQSMIKNSIIMGSTNISHHSSIENSIIARGCTAGPRFATISSRFKKILRAEILEVHEGGSVIGDDCKIGADVSIYAGCRIGSGTKIPSGMKIKEDAGDVI